MIVAGADVWKGKWVVVVLDNGAFSHGFVAPTFERAIEGVTDAAVVGVDIPIGLPQGGERRLCDIAAREFVGVRRNSVFFTPSGELLNCPTAAAANELARQNSWSGVSAQTFALKHQILAVQPFAGQDARIFEVHPEVSFKTASGAELPWAKSTWNGQMHRREILRAQGITLPNNAGPLGLADPADLLDAAIVAWSAHRIAAGVSTRFPATSSRQHAIHA